MDRRGKSVLVISALALLTISLIFILTFNFSFAAQFRGDFLNGSIISPYNLSVGEQNITIVVTNQNSGVNITQVNITLPNGFTFRTTSNTTSPAISAGPVLITGEANFTYAGNTLMWLNLTQAVINGTNPPTGVNARAFGIYVNATVVGGPYGINVSTVDSNGIFNSTILTITVGQDITTPTVQLLNASDTGYEAIGTLNNSVFNTTATINLSCNMSDFIGLSSVTLFLQGINGPSFTNSSIPISGTYNQTNYTHTFSQPGTYLWYCQVRDTSNNIQNSPSNKITVNAFSLNGLVKQANFSKALAANVSIYEYIQGQPGQGPPTQRIIKSTLTNSSGGFTLTDIQNNGSMATIYKIKVSLNNSDGLITEIGPNLPQMPREPLVFSMNGGTFYLQNATTFKLYAYNNISTAGPPTVTNSVKAIKFGYEVIDQALGYPIESYVQGGYDNATVTVPANRNYTIMFVRDPASFQHAGPGGGGMELCQGPGYMNETDCPSPPSSISVTSDNIINLQNSSEINSTNYTSPTALLITVNKSLAFSQHNLTGCLNIVGNSTDVNVSDIIAKMIPWAGFLPPVKGEVSDFDATNTAMLKQGVWGCALGRFNVTLMGSSGGISWFIEAYAGNSTAGQYFGAFQNITIYNNDAVFNLTLIRLLGTYVAEGEINTSKIQINITDSNGTAPQNAHVEVYVKNPVFGTMHYIIETLANGKFNFTLLNNTQEARVMVFSNQYAPKEVKINLGANRTDVTLYSFRPQQIMANGSVNSSRKSGSELAMKFMRYSTACNVYTPADSCMIGNQRNADFDPLQAMMAGKSNFWMKTSSNITLYFTNVDMLTSGPPDAMMGDDASSASSGASSLEQVWKLGSMAPNVYDSVMIGIPYNSSVNENWTYYINLSLLYDNDNNVIWNATANTTAQLPSDYSDFNTTWFGTPGMLCINSTTTNTTSITDCFINKTDADGHSGYFWFTIPHFSTTASKISGIAPATTSPPTGTSGGGGGTATTTYDISTTELTSAIKDLGVGEAIKFKVENTTHTLKLIGLTASSASVQIRSIVITKLLQIGKEELADIDSDGVNELSLLLNNVSLSTMKANITVKSLVYVAPTAEITPATNVTSAVCGNAIVESGENCGTCPSDVKCASDEECKNAVCTKKIITEKTPVMKWILIASIIIIAIIALILIIRVAKKK